METLVADLSPHKLEELISRAIDRHMQVWLTQLLDAIGDVREGDEAELQPEYQTALKSALSQAQGGDVMSLDDFRNQLFDN